MESGESKDHMMMREEQHYHADQGMEVDKMMTDKRESTSEVASLMAPRALTEQPTLEQYLKKLGLLEAAAAASGVPSSSLAGGNLDVGEDEKAKESDDDDLYGENLDDSSLAQAKADGSREQESAASMRILNLLASDTKDAKPAKQSPSGSKKSAGLPRQSSSQSLLGADEAASQTSAKAASGQDVAATTKSWLDKIDLTEIFGGKKLGVKFFHAETFAQKIATSDPSTSTVLLNRAQLGRWATSLSVASLSDPKVTDLGMSDAIAGLQNTTTSLPGPNQFALFSRQLVPILKEALASPSDAALQRLLAFVKPALAEGELPTKSWASMALGSAQVKAEMRMAKFMSIMMEYFCSLISQGEAKKAALTKMVSGIESWAADQFTLEIPDSMVEKLLELQTVLEPLSLLLSGDAMAQLSHFGELDALRKTMRTTMTSALARIGNALAADKHYSNLVLEVFQCITALQTHEAKLTGVHQTVYFTEAKDGDEYARELLDMAATVSFLMQEVKWQHIQDMVLKAKAKVMELMDGSLQLWESQQQCRVSLDVAEKLLAEAWMTLILVIADGTRRLGGAMEGNGFVGRASALKKTLPEY